MFAGSSCNSVVTMGSLVISGHFDKKLRFWDKRADAQSNEILLPAKVTSLELASGKLYLLRMSHKLRPASYPRHPELWDKTPS